MAFGFFASPDVPFLVYPLWNERGQAQVGVFQDGGMRRCLSVNGFRRCVQIIWPETWFAHHRPLAGIVSWHGSLLEDKQDATGTLYRRNRYYDPASGRFTQEDPIGLAGGLNVYGFANGDPVNYGDPYGLCPECREGDDGVRHREGFWNRLRYGVYEPCSAGSNADCSPTPVMAGMPSFIGGPGKSGFRMLSRIGQHTGLTRLASRLSGAAQESADNLVQQLSRGNFNPGIGTKHLIGDVFYARARDGTRVFFRRVGEDAVEIVGKATKATEDQVISILSRIYQ